VPFFSIMFFSSFRFSPQRVCGMLRQSTAAGYCRRRYRLNVTTAVSSRKSLTCYEDVARVGRVTGMLLYTRK